MPQKRRLEDLYVIGKEIEFDDGAEEPGPDGPVKAEPVTVWLRKLNPVENQTASRKASAARSRVRSAAKQPDSDEYQAIWLDVLDYGEEPEPLIDYIAMGKVAEATLKAESRAAAEEEWSKDNYLQGLYDAWHDGMRTKYLADTENPDSEALNVFHELERFNEQAKVLAEREIEEIKADYAGWSMDRLRDKTLEIMLIIRGNTAWLDEFHYSELWLGTFETDRKTRYFNAREEVDRLPESVLTRLLNEYQELSVDVIEGKGSEETSDSSPSSEQQDEAATDDSSGLAAATQ